MTRSTITPLPDPSGSSPDPLTEVLRSGARRLIEQAVEAELTALLATHAGERTGDGRARLVRHGHLPEREVMTGVGPVPVKVPRVRDRGEGAEKVRFTSSILPPYPRNERRQLSPRTEQGPAEILNQQTDLVLTDQGASATASYMESAAAEAQVTPIMADFCAAPWPDFAPPLTSEFELAWLGRAKHGLFPSSAPRDCSRCIDVSMNETLAVIARILSADLSAKFFRVQLAANEFAQLAVASSKAYATAPPTISRS